MRQSFVKAAKEFFRVVALAVVPVLIMGLQDGFVNPRAVAVIAAIAGLRFIDKFLHELGKDTKSPALVGGLTRF